eukprot:12845252-Alexandrium_andersonii.AAC.1
MSASLVGSEMCIRDRSNTHEPPSTQAGTRTREVRCAFVASLTASLFRGCLLYTSDAADDM